MNRVNFQSLLEQIGGERRIEYSLDRIRQALGELRHPEKGVNSIVIAGTNGKGTTSLLVSHALKAAGKRVFTYLSPHLQHPKERFLLDLEPIEENELEAMGQEFFPLASRFGLSYFEFLTLIGFVWAKRRAAEYLVLEVGMGGRLDATNVTDPLAVALTNVDLDHQSYLGRTREAILKEKLGVLNSEGLLFTSLRDHHLLSQVEAACAEKDAIYYYSHELAVDVKAVNWEENRQRISVNGHALELSSPTHGMSENAALAFLLIRIVFPAIPIETVQAAFRGCVVPGRFEMVSTNPRVILSGDHNPAGIRSLIKTFERLGKRPTHILAGFSPDKPHEEMMELLLKICPDLTVTQIPGRITHYGEFPEGVFYEEDPFLALEGILSRLERDETLLITGSLYLVGALRKHWHPQVSFLPTPTSRPVSLRKSDAATRAIPPRAAEERNLVPRV